MAIKAAKDNKEGEWKTDSFDVNMKSIALLEERSVSLPIS